MTSETETDGSLFEPGRNCWRAERADRVGLIVDAADYFVRLRQALMAARRQVLLVGWDFDFEIDMVPGQSEEDGLAPDGLPNALGDFLEAVVARTPELRLYLLKWNGAVAMAPGRFLPTVALRIWGDDRIRFALDGHHPTGACHHQKIVVIDDALAFCGGIDVTEDRWDTPGHTPDDPRRVRKDGSPSTPWHDATAALTGPVAAALGDLSRMRWGRATGEALEAPEGAGEVAWPDDLPTALRGADIAIARTEPPYDDEPMVDEIERLYLDGIAAARDVIYFESQYFSADTVCDALEGRLREPDGPEIAVVNPQAALSYFEDQAIHPLRGRMIERLRAVDPGGRFRIWHPVNEAGEPIYVHAKVMVVDDRLVRLGSSNLDARSMGFDTECDVAFEGRDAASRQVVTDFRLRLVGEHLGVEPEAVARAWDERGSLVAAIEALNGGEGRGLREIEKVPEDPLGRFLADTRLLDTRFYPGQPSLAGRGLRPRHLAVGLVVLGVGAAALYAWTSRDRRA